MNKAYIKDGKLLVDSHKSPILCQHNPCNINKDFKQYYKVKIRHK